MDSQKTLKQSNAVCFWAQKEEVPGHGGGDCEGADSVITCYENALNDLQDRLLYDAELQIADAGERH